MCLRLFAARQVGSLLIAVVVEGTWLRDTVHSDEEVGYICERSF